MHAFYYKIIMHEKKRYRVGNVSETFIQNSYINSVGRVLVL